MVNTVIKATDARTASNRAIKKQQKVLLIWLGIKLLRKLQKFHKIHRKMTQRQLTVTNENDKEIPKERFVR